jgi:hypothetical protein
MLRDHENLQTSTHKIAFFKTEYLHNAVSLGQKNQRAFLGASVNVQ